MKKCSILLLLLVGFWGVTAQGIFTVEGDIRNTPKNFLLRTGLVKGNLLELNKENYITPQEGRFRMEIPVPDGLSEVVLLSNKSSKYLRLQAQPGATAQLTGKGAQPHKWSVESDVAAPAGAGKSTPSAGIAPLKKGSPVADAELPDLQGRMHRLSEYKGRYILLDFWSVGCAPCLEAMPELREIHKANGDRLAIVGINLDTWHEQWAGATGRFGVVWDNLNAPFGSETAARYGVKIILHQVLISPDGTVLGMWSGYRKNWLRDKLEKFIPELK